MKGRSLDPLPIRVEEYEKTGENPYCLPLEVTTPLWDKCQRKELIAPLSSYVFGTKPIRFYLSSCMENTFQKTDNFVLIQKNFMINVDSLWNMFILKLFPFCIFSSPWYLSCHFQLRQKNEEAFSLVCRLHEILTKRGPQLVAWCCYRRKQLNSNIPFILDYIRPSPVVDGYRNKYEFSVGEGLSSASKWNSQFFLF